MKEETKKNLIKNSFWNFIMSLFNRVGALIFTVILARFLLPENYGIYSLVISISMIFYSLADLGINQTLIRYISNSSGNNKDKIPIYYKFLLRYKIYFSVLSSLFLLILSYPLAFYFFKNPLLFLPLAISSIYVLIFSFDNFYLNLIFSLEGMPFLGLREFLSQIIKIILALFVFYFTVTSNHIAGLFISLIISSLVVIPLSLIYVNKNFPILNKKSFEKINAYKINKFLFYMTLISLSTVFIAYIDSIILGFFLDPKWVGFYRASLSLIIGITGILGFINTLLLSFFSKINKNKKVIFNRIFNYLCLITIPATFGILALGNYFIIFLFDYSFLQSSLSLYFLSPLIFLMTVSSIFQTFFSAKERPQISVRLILITSILNIILNLLLIKLFINISPIWATAGASIANVITWITYLILSIYYLNSNFRIKIDYKPIIKIIIASFFMFVILKFFLIYVKTLNLLLGILGVFVGVIIYFMILFLIKGIKKEDFQLFYLLFKK